MIYIDPSYNTDKDFVYKDNFARSREKDLTKSGQVNEKGNRLVPNLESNGQFPLNRLSIPTSTLKSKKNPKYRDYYF